MYSVRVFADRQSAGAAIHNMVKSQETFEELSDKQLGTALETGHPGVVNKKLACVESIDAPA